MRFGVLGPLEVRTVTGRPVRVPEVKVRTLLACLIADHGRVVPTARLIDALWAGAPPANPTASLQAKVSQLRRVLEDAEEGARDLVVHRAPGYVLQAAPDTVDVGRFRTLVAHSRALEDPRARATALSKALALWRGPAFADFADEPFVRTAFAGLEEERLTAVEEHMEARLDLGEHSLLMGELTALVTAHPLRERMRMAHMRALYHVGRSSEALDSYTDLRRHLAEELGLTPGQAIEALQQAILRQDPALNRVTPEAGTAPSARARTNLPDAAGDLVGREGAVTEGRRLLARHRLVTFTGPGGVGKTRLAVAAAAGLAEEFPDGIWLVELAGLGLVDGPEVLSCVSQQVLAALDIRESTDGTTAEADLGDTCRSVRRLVEFAESRRMLLVLDNCEHMVDDVAMLVGRLLEQAPGVRVLATSQEPLRVQGEAVWPVPPLELPESTELEALERSSAVRLFVERARSADPSFVVDARTAEAIAAVCRRLDGIPLALELAATRVRALGIHQLLERLDDRFRVLKSGYRGAPHRQQTLQATIEWSWSLLTPEEQTVLRRLSAHVDGCTLEAAEQVCAGGEVAADDVVDILARLVDRSLVVRSDAPHGARYQLLESVAVYAQARLVDSGEAVEVARRHAVHYVRLAEAARPHLGGPEQHHWLRRLSAETGNFRRTLQELRGARSAEPALRLVNALAWFWVLMGRLTEAHRSLCSALELVAVPPGPETVAEPSEAGGPAQPAGPAAAEAAAWCQGIGLLLGEVRPEEHCQVSDHTAPGVRTEGLARAKWFTGNALWDVGALAAAEAEVSAALADFRALRDEWGVAAALSSRAALAMTRGDLESLHDDALEARSQFIRLGDAWGELKTAQVLAVHAEITASYEQAAQLHREGLGMAESLELWPEASRQLSGLGRIALLSGRFEEADEFHRRAMRLAVEQGNRPAEQMAELGLALGARRRGDLDAAERHLRPWLAWNRSREANNGLALVLAELGFCAELRGDVEGSLARHRDGLSAALVSEDPRAVALALEGLACAYALSGRPARATRAARLLGTAEATREQSGAPLPPAEQADVRRAAARAVETLGAEMFAVEHAAGRSVDHRLAADSELSGSAAPVDAGGFEEPDGERRPRRAGESRSGGAAGGLPADAVAEEAAGARSLRARAPRWLGTGATGRDYGSEDDAWPGRDIPA
ncbi:BTAD domain-containing putative transcriptional regulator [Streptomyces sp. NPDC001595]|uniref:BTAD domain-containing putative transcriptional regulator n=1 Tax=Streptomyces sp. NPDC001532 TaxID=3154520 RepID=UPI003319B301